MDHSLTRRAALATLAAALARPSGTTSAWEIDATPIAGAANGWPLYGADLAGTRLAPATSISAATVGRLQPAWRVEVGAPISGTPVVAGGLAYVGAYDGRLRALDLASGEERWGYDTGARVREPNLGIDLGIVGSAAVSDNVVYVGDATASVLALDAASGTPRWRTTVDRQPAACIWSSPVVWHGRVYVGVASVSKEPGFRGSVVALDASSGKVLWQTYLAPAGADGAGVFAVPAVDPARGALYVGTQNAYSPHPPPYGNPIAIVALDAETGAERWAFRAPPGGGATAPTDDVGFSASPNLFATSVGGRQRDLVGAGQKSGVYWALDRDTGAVVWHTQVAPAGPLGGMEGTAAVAAGAVAAPATNWPDPAGSATGLLCLLDAGSGRIRWTAAQPAPVASPATIAGDVVLQGGMDGTLRAYALADGREAWRADLGASVGGGIAVAGESIVLGAASPPFAPFVRPGAAVVAFRLGPAATPEAAATMCRSEPIGAA